MYHSECHHPVIVVYCTLTNNSNTGDVLYNVNSSISKWYFEIYFNAPISVHCPNILDIRTFLGCITLSVIIL